MGRQVYTSRLFLFEAYCKPLGQEWAFMRLYGMTMNMFITRISVVHRSIDDLT
jgi:hypothetical protein